MEKKTGIKLIEEGRQKKYGYKKDTKGKCPICGAPGGKLNCKECGWGIEDLGPEFSTSLKDPVTTLINAKFSYKGVKKENADLQEKVKALLLNNQKLSELVEALRSEIELLKIKESGKANAFSYKYEEGGWGESLASENAKFHIKKEKITVNDINSQLTHIMNALNKYKTKGKSINKSEANNIQ